VNVLTLKLCSPQNDQWITCVRSPTPLRSPLPAPVLPSGTQTNFDGRRLGGFLEKEGPRDGANSPAFDIAYVYFENLRIRGGKKETKKREVMGEAWGRESGMWREGGHNMWITLLPGEKG